MSKLGDLEHYRERRNHQEDQRGLLLGALCRNGMSDEQAYEMVINYTLAVLHDVKCGTFKAEDPYLGRFRKKTKLNWWREGLRSAREVIGRLEDREFILLNKHRPELFPKDRTP